MYNALITGLRTLNELLSAGIAITAFSLFFYALTFNLRERITRSFALILTCVVIVYVGDAIGSTAGGPNEMTFWLRLQWVGITLLPAAYLHFSDALLATTGRPSRGRRRLAVRLTYLLSLAFLASLPFSLLVGPLVEQAQPAPHLARTWLTSVFSAYYLFIMIWAGVNLVRAYRRTLARVSRRRMGYLLVGALAPALGSYPYLLFGSGLAGNFPLLFWFTATASNLLVSALLIVMSYSVAFFGVPWPDRVVKRRLFKWLMRGPVTASTALAVTTIIRRSESYFGIDYPAAIPIVMVATVLIMEHTITIAAPLWERWLFHGRDRDDIALLQRLEERLLTSGDLYQFLESALAAVCDRAQSSGGFLAAFSSAGPEMVVTIGKSNILEKEDLSAELFDQVSQNGTHYGLFTWGELWLLPLYDPDALGEELLGLIGIEHMPDQETDEEMVEALLLLAERAAQALVDRRTQQQVFASLEELTPEVELIQQLRAAASYGDSSSIAELLSGPSGPVEDGSLAQWVKDALTHYWGGPKLTESPLIGLRVVQEALDEHDGNPTNALRAILRKAIDRVRPEGERRFTAEWILYNLLELKFMEGRKVREVALRLAVSEADLYRKQRVAIEAVANAILEMENNAREEYPPAMSVIEANANQS